ncbi:MAG: hypothetical protein KC547_21890, partial [Anaerolineae bacterium]|nr:hypothetical protein [Anaerolineae bacterium]
MLLLLSHTLYGGAEKRVARFPPTSDIDQYGLLTKIIYVTMRADVVTGGCVCARRGLMFKKRG